MATKEHTQNDKVAHIGMAIETLAQALMPLPESERKEVSGLLHTLAFAPDSANLKRKIAKALGYKPHNIKAVVYQFEPRRDTFADLAGIPNEGRTGMGSDDKTEKP